MAEEEPPGCKFCSCQRSSGVTMATQTMVTWVDDPFTSIEESMVRMEESLDHMKDHVEETAATDVKERNIIEEIIDEAISEASSRSRPNSAAITETEQEDLVLALSDSEGSADSRPGDEGTEAEKTKEKKGRRVKKAQKKTIEVVEKDENTDIIEEKKQNRTSRRKVKAEEEKNQEEDKQPETNVNKKKQEEKEQDKKQEENEQSETTMIKKKQKLKGEDKKQEEKQKEDKKDEEKKKGDNKDQESKTEDKTNDAFYNLPASLCVHTREGGHKQELRVGIERNPRLMDIWREYGPDIVVQEDNDMWVRGDASLPAGWQFTEPSNVAGRQVRQFRSPCGMVFRSREEVVEWLLQQGATLVTPTGHPMQPTDESKCKGYCEGSCALMAIKPSFYSKGDYNKKRKKTKISRQDAEAKIRNKITPSSPKLMAGPGLCYGGARFTADKPRLICLEEEENKTEHVEAVIRKKRFLEEPKNTDEKHNKVPVAVTETKVEIKKNVIEAPEETNIMHLENRTKATGEKNKEHIITPQKSNILGKRLSRIQTKDVNHEIDSKTKTPDRSRSRSSRSSRLGNTPNNQESTEENYPCPKSGCKEWFKNDSDLDGHIVGTHKSPEKKKSEIVDKMTPAVLETKNVGKRKKPSQENHEVDENLTVDTNGDKVNVKEDTGLKRSEENTRVDESDTPVKETKNGGKGKKSSKNLNMSPKETVNLEIPKSDDNITVGVSATKDDKRKISEALKNMAQKETVDLEIPKVNEKLTVNMSPTKDDKVKITDALNNQPLNSPNIQEKFTSKQAVEALKIIFSSSKRKPMSNSADPPPAKEQKISEVDITENTHVDGQAGVKTKSKLVEQVQESVIAPMTTSKNSVKEVLAEGRDSPMTISSESEAETVPLSNTPSVRSVQSVDISDTDNSDPGQAQQSTPSRISRSVKAQPKTNGTVILSDTDGSEVEGKKAETEGSNKPKRGQGKPLNVKPPVLVTPKHMKNNTVEKEETPKRSKRKLDSVLSELEESTKKIKATQQKSVKTPKTPKVSEQKTPSSLKTPKNTNPVSDVNTSDEETNTKLNIMKIKELQKQEISLIKKEGTYVQCSNKDCGLWRLVTEYEDPATVPDNWICSMNKDPEANICGEGGEKVEDEETVDVEYTCGSMVWAKLKGFPLHPGMVDYCPDTQEFYWVEEDLSQTVPSWYNVVFFEGEGNSVTRSWVKTEDLNKMVEPLEHPASWAKVKGSKTARLKSIFEMAKKAFSISREERLERYSFVALFKGKWGKYADLTIGEEPEDEEGSAKKKKKIELVKTPKSAKSTPKTPQTQPLPKKNKASSIETPKTTSRRNTMDGQLKASPVVLDSKKKLVETPKSTSRRSTMDGQTKPTRISIDSQKRLTGTPKPTSRKNSVDENQGKMNLDSPRKSIQSSKDVSTEKVSHTDTRNFGKSGDKVSRSTDESKFKKDERRNSVDSKTPQKKIALVKSSTPSSNNAGEVSKHDRNGAVKEEEKIKIPPTPTTILSPLATQGPVKDSTTPRTIVRLTSKDSRSYKKTYCKPPLPSDVMIALAVRNLDPENHYGAKFSSIQAFLSLHFPYYNDQKLECREMIRRAYDINAKEETGKENFRIKGSLVEQVLDYSQLDLKSSLFS